MKNMLLLAILLYSVKLSCAETNFVPSHVLSKDTIKNFINQEVVCTKVKLDHYKDLKVFAEELKTVEDTYQQLPQILAKLQQIDAMLENLGLSSENEKNCTVMQFSFNTQILRGRFRSVRSLSETDPSLLRLKSKELASFDSLLSKYCLTEQGGQYRLTATHKTDCFIQILDNVLPPTIVNMGGDSRDALYTFIESSRTRLPKIFLDKLGALLNIQYKSNSQAERKNQILKHLETYNYFDTQVQNAESVTSTTEAAPTTKVETSTLEPTKSDFELLGDTIILAKQKIDKNTNELSSFVEEEKVDDALSFKSSLSQLLHQLNLFHRLLLDPVDNEIVPRLGEYTKFKDLEYEKETSSLYIFYLRYQGENVFLATPIDICGSRICINVQPLSNYLLKNDREGYDIEQCKKIDSMAYSCTELLDITQENCMSLEQSMIYNNHPECVVSRTNHPVEQVISYQDKLVVSVYKGQDIENFGNLELDANKVHILSTKIPQTITLFNKRYFLNESIQEFNYMKVTLPFSVDQLDYYGQILEPSGYAYDTTQTNVNTSFVVTLYVMMFLLCSLLLHYRRIFKKLMKERENRKKIIEKIRLREKERKVSFAPCAPPAETHM